LVSTIFVLILMTDYAPVVRNSFPGTTPQAGLGEFFALPIFTCVGLMYLVSAIDFVFIFVSLELVTISFYVLVSFTRRNPMTLEAGTKYLVLSALSTAFLVYGIAWIFGVTGQTNLQRIADVLANPATDRSAALLGMVFVLVALGFKIAAVPFQIWVPDVYQGAPTPVTAYLSVGSKAAGFIVLLRVLQPFLALPQTQRLIVVIALLTLIYGNLAAVLAGVLIALKHVVSGKFYFLLWKPIENQKDNHPRDTNFKRNRCDYFVIRRICRQVAPAFEIMCHEIIRIVR
jgi:NADH-quinone oxidoreductase subunit N